MPEPLDVADAHVVIELPVQSCKEHAATPCKALCDPLATHQVPEPCCRQCSLQSSSQSRSSSSTEGNSSTASSSIGSSSRIGCSIDTPECRICLSAGDAKNLVQPCSCSGTLSYTHTACLSAWVHERGSLVCELCAQPYKEPYTQQLEAVVAAKAASKGVVARASAMTASAKRSAAFVLLSMLVGSAGVVILVALMS